MSFEISEQQNKALHAVQEWYNTDQKYRAPIFRIFGYAGVGKTTIAKLFAETVKGNVLYAAFTGKAALVLNKSGCTGASTIHSLIYKAKEDADGNIRFVLNRRSPLADAALLVVDECSMVDSELGNHLLSFNVPILVLGDPGQLPPISGAGFFTNAEPDIMLTEIHRQAKDNPIIWMATKVREGGTLKIGTYGDSVVSDKLSLQDFMETEQTIVGRNNTRTMLNQRYRTTNGFDEQLPMVNERLICLKNDKTLGIFNGGMFNVQGKLDNKHPSYHKYVVKDLDTPENRALTVKVHDSLFMNTPKPHWKMLKGTQEFDYGYAITAHKSQGSQWENTLIFDESYCFRDNAHRWLYTAITRSQEWTKIYVDRG